MRFLTSLLVVLGVLATASFRGAEAHGYMSNPQPRARTIPGHPFQFEPQSDGTLNGECQDGGQIGPIQVTWTAGQEISIDAIITAEHGGWVELRLCADPRGGNACFEQTRLESIPPSSVAPADTPPSSTDAVLSPARFRNDQRAGTTRWRLPAGFTCEHCAMQWWWITNNFGNEHFKTCHDVRIVGGGQPTTTTTSQQPTTTTTTQGQTTTTTTAATTTQPNGELCPWDDCVVGTAGECKNLANDVCYAAPDNSGVCFPGTTHCSTRGLLALADAPAATPSSAMSGGMGGGIGAGAVVFGGALLLGGVAFRRRKKKQQQAAPKQYTEQELQEAKVDYARRAGMKV